MIKLKPYSASFLTLGGFILIGMGIYFIFLRPPLLPEDSRYIGLSLSAIRNNIPDLSTWLQKVFWVMGGYILTTGLFTIYILRKHLFAQERREHLSYYQLQESPPLD